MKRLLCVCVVACLVLLGGCGIGAVTITPEQNTFPIDTEYIPVVWRNGTLGRIMFGEAFTLQHWDDGEWVELEPVNGLLFYLIGYGLRPGQSRRHTYAIGWAELTPGRYRIAASFSFDRDRPIGPDDLHQIYAEFEVS